MFLEAVDVSQDDSGRDVGAQADLPSPGQGTCVSEPRGSSRVCTRRRGHSRRARPGACGWPGACGRSAACPHSRWCPGRGWSRTPHGPRSGSAHVAAEFGHDHLGGARYDLVVAGRAGRVEELDVAQEVVEQKAVMRSDTAGEKFWMRLVESLDLPGLADDARFRTFADRLAHRGALVPCWRTRSGVAAPRSASRGSAGGCRWRPCIPSTRHWRTSRWRRAR